MWVGTALSLSAGSFAAALPSWRSVVGGLLRGLAAAIEIRIGGRFARGSERPASSADWLASQKCTRYQALRLRSRTLRDCVSAPDTRRSQSRPIGAPAAPERRLQ